jgi:osmotically-inducible protein OsmY
MRGAKGFVLGAGLAYYLDPQNGKRRRRVLVDRAASAARRIGRLVGKKARYAEGRGRGVAAEVAGKLTSEPVATDDATVLQRIRSDALRDVGLTTKEIDVEVLDGVATVEGTVDSTALGDDLVARVRAVPGVKDVDSRISVSLRGPAERTEEDVRLT